MDNPRIKEYLVDFYKRELPKLTKRDLVVSKNSKIITFIGPRRAGKTYYMFQIIGDLLENGIEKAQILYLNCEDTRLLQLRYDEVRDVIKLYWELYPSKKKEFYLLIDEPQVIERWEAAVRSLHDEGINLFISGSSSKLLSKEIATSLRGRSISYFVLPFSFGEYLKINNQSQDNDKLSSKEKAMLLYHLNEYLNYGGFPEIIKEKDNNMKAKIINEYYELIVYKDMVDRYKVKNSNLIKWLIRTLITNCSNELSINKIYLSLKSQQIKASKNTLYSYLSLLEDVLFIHQLPKFSYSERKRELSLNKVYLSDNCFIRLAEIKEDYGKKMENVMFLSLFRNKNPLEGISYWKNSQKEEVDFVISESKKINSLIQVCSDIADSETKKREIRALLKAGQELKCKNLIVITKDYEKEAMEEWFGTKANVKYIPIWKWLLES